MFLSGLLGPGDRPAAPRPPDDALLGDVPDDSCGLCRASYEEALRDQSHGGIDATRRHAVLRVCAREAEDSLSQYALSKGERFVSVRSVFAVANQSGDNLLQFDAAGGTLGEEDHGSRIFLLLYSFAHGSGTRESRWDNVPFF